MPPVSPTLNVMIRAAEKSSKSLLRDFGEVEQLQVSVKGPHDFVSAADIRAEEIIFNELSKARPTFGFLMEERGEVAGTDPGRWIVDPLDGTKNFLHGIPHWSISIALEWENEIVAGVIYDPVRDEMFHAEKGQGAFLGGRKRLRVSGRKRLQDALIFPGTPSYTARADDAYLEQIRQVFARCDDARQMGSACLDLAYVAAGRTEAYWQRYLKPWDIAAGAVIVREAGGVIKSLDDHTNPVYSNFVFASNMVLHNELLEVVRR